MELIAQNSERLDLFVSPREFSALMREDGMLAKVSPEHSPSISHESIGRGAVLSIGRQAAQAIISAVPEHACDDVLRQEVAEWCYESDRSNELQKSGANTFR